MNDPWVEIPPDVAPINPAASHIPFHFALLSGRLVPFELLPNAPLYKSTFLLALPAYFVRPLDPSYPPMGPRSAQSIPYFHLIPPPRSWGRTSRTVWMAWLVMAQIANPASASDTRPWCNSLYISPPWVVPRGSTTFLISISHSFEKGMQVFSKYQHSARSRGFHSSFFFSFLFFNSVTRVLSTLHSSGRKYRGWSA